MKVEMSYIKIWIHTVWGTKKRLSFLTPDIKGEIINHIKDNELDSLVYQSMFLYNSKEVII